ncbi:MAG: DUF3347 domain-containing protein [Acidobacteria bacterium]|nr:DUF3347 domain-containing protein [Acidobacteriota bacterium]
MRSNSVVFAGLFLLLNILGTAGAGEKDLPALEKYISAQQALVGDDYAKAKSALTSLATQGEGEVKRLAQAAAETNNIEAMRTAFKSLSEQLIKMELPKGYAVAFCPMADNNKGASWIQKDGQVMNPYYGSSMPHCGTIKEHGQK